ncbi:MAG: HAMP domain-containing protein [Caulobacteraceae bacterium]
MRLTLTSVRAKLAALAVAGLVLMSLLTVLLLQTTQAAYDVVERAAESHERMRSFTRLRYAGDQLQTLTYAAVRSGQPAEYRAQDAARAEFIAALRHVEALPQTTDRERQVAARVRQQGQVVLALFSKGSDIVRRVDARWRTSGSRAALIEVQDLSKPYFAFTKTVTDEIAAGDAQIGDATRRTLSLQRSVTVAALVSLALGLALAGAIFLVLLTRLGPGLKKLETGARAFSRGDLRHRIGLAGRDELAQLSALFDSMALQLSEKQAALQDVTAGLEQAVAARTAELEKANAALSAEDERRRAFLADVSHELRTPPDHHPRRGAGGAAGRRPDPHRPGGRL